MKMGATGRNIRLLENRKLSSGLWSRRGFCVVALVIGMLSWNHHQTLFAQGAEEKITELEGKIAGLFEARRFGEAAVFAKQILQINEGRFGPDHPKTGESVSNLARLYVYQGKYVEAEPLFLRELKIREEQLGADHLEIGGFANYLAQFYQFQGKYAEAEPLFLRALKISEAHLGPDHPDTGAYLNNLAFVYGIQRKLEEAEPLYLRALKIREKHLGAVHPDTRASLDGLAQIYQSQGKYKEAEPLFLRTLRISEVLSGPEHPDTGTNLNYLAVLYYFQGKYDKAEPLFLRALKIREAQLGADHPETAMTVNNLASLYRIQGKYEEAEPHFLRALRIQEKQLGPEHLETAMTLNNLASLFQARGKNEEAEPLFLRALKIREAQLGASHPETAKSLNNLALLYQAQGRYQEAEPLFLRALKISEEQSGPDHPDAATNLNNLALLYQFQAKFEEAEELFLRALKIRERQLGAAHPDTGAILNNLAYLYLDRGKVSDAESAAKFRIESDSVHWSRMLNYFSERECLLFQRMQSPLELSGNTGSGGLAADAQIRFKGAVAEAMNNRRAAEKALRKTKEGSELLEKRQSMATRYRKAYLENLPDLAEIRSELERVDKKVVTLLNDTAGNSTPAIGTGIESVQGVMGRNETLIETFSYYHHNAMNDFESRYSSTLIAKDGEPVYLPHGSAQAIDEAIHNYRTGIQVFQGIGPSKAVGEIFTQSEEKLFSILLAPLEEHLIPGQKVIFSGDGQLHFLPLGMLRGPDGKTFNDKYDVRYVTSGRDLANKRPLRNERKKRSALILGSPSYSDKSPLVAMAKPETIGEGNVQEKDLLASLLKAGMSSDTGGIEIQPLPGTALEIKFLDRRLKESDYEVVSLSGDGANEAALIAAIESHDIVHLATHGFFLNEMKIGKKRNKLDSGQLGRSDGLNVIQNPMYRSGLALAGAETTFNLWGNGEVPPPSQDGILLAAEVTSLDLRATDLVVLSACETAAGESLDGEGVIGLRRALYSAGANNVIMTLWPVDDISTVEVMEAFYEKYLNGAPPPRALAEVQRELFRSWIDKYGEVGAIARLAPFICTSIGKAE